MIGFVGSLILFALVAYVLCYGYKNSPQESVANATPRERASVGLVCFAGFVFLQLYMYSNDSERRDFVREQFALSDDVELVAFEFVQGNNRARRGTTTATYRFTDQQLREYTAKVDNPAQWGALSYTTWNGRVIGGVNTAKVRQWQQFPRPIYAADMKGLTFNDLPWIYSLWWEQDWESIKNGRIMCYLFQKVDRLSKNVDSATAAKIDPDDPYLVSACSEVAKSNFKQYYVLAILDFDRKTLFVRL